MTKAAEKLGSIGPDRSLVGLAALLAALLLFQPLRLGATGIWAWRMGRSAEAAVRNAPARNESEPLEDFDPILDQGFIGGRAPKGEPPEPSLFGVLGNEALLGMSSDKAKFYEVGAEVPGGEKIVSIGTNKVVLEKDGKERTIEVFGDRDKKKGPAGPQGPPPTPAKKEDKGPTPEAPKEATPVEAAPQAPPPSSGSSLNAETMVGTRWSYQGTSLSFDSDGKLTIAAGDETIEGTWSVDGDTITVEVMGETHTAQIDGDSITVDGNTIERVE